LANAGSWAGPGGSEGAGVVSTATEGESVEAVDEDVSAVEAISPGPGGCEGVDVVSVAAEGESAEAMDEDDVTVEAISYGPGDMGAEGLSSVAKESDGAGVGAGAGTGSGASDATGRSCDAGEGIAMRVGAFDEGVDGAAGTASSARRMPAASVSAAANGKREW